MTPQKQGHALAEFWPKSYPLMEQGQAFGDQIIADMRLALGHSGISLRLFRRLAGQRKNLSGDLGLVHVGPFGDLDEFVAMNSRLSKSIRG